MNFSQCKIFESSSSSEVLQGMINKWLNEKKDTIQIRGTDLTECAYPASHSLVAIPSFHMRTVVIWYEPKKTGGDVLG